MTTSNIALLSAISAAETGGEPNPFIRTREIPPEGSTAYGPAQITMGLAKDFLDNRSDLFNKEEKAYLKRFLAQAKKFNKYGNNPKQGGDTTKLKGYEPRFDYGGEGELTSEQDQQLYKDVAEKMLGFTLTKNNGVIEDTIKEWRFGAKSTKGRKNDTAYFERVEAALPKGIEEGDVLTSPLVDIEGEVRASIQRQLAEQNVAPTAPQELSGGLTEEEQAELDFLRDDLASRAEEEPTVGGLTGEEQAELDALRSQLGEVQKGAAFEEAPSEQDLIEEIF